MSTIASLCLLPVPSPWEVPIFSFSPANGGCKWIFWRCTHGWASHGSSWRDLGRMRPLWCGWSGFGGAEMSSHQVTHHTSSLSCALWCSQALLTLRALPFPHPHGLALDLFHQTTGTHLVWPGELMSQPTWSFPSHLSPAITQRPMNH